MKRKAEGEIGLITDALTKNRVGAKLYTLDELFGLSDRGVQGLFSDSSLGEELSVILDGGVSEQTLYKITDSFRLRYILIPIESDEVLFIGPYLASHLSDGELVEISEKNNLSPSSGRHLRELFDGIRVLRESNPIFIFIDTLCERIWHSSSFSIAELDGKAQELNSLTSKKEKEDGALVSLKALEVRYGNENEMMFAVSEGQLHKEKQLFSRINAKTFENRLADSVRNAKNYMIIMNTLLRKAAERGGVHPFYIDALSSAVAKRIEDASSVIEAPALMREMFREYCQLVRRTREEGYSPLVRSTVMIIDSDITADLSLGSLAREQSVSPAYLSQLFSREVGTPLSRYVNEKRMNYAAYLLENTGLQIQTVALHSGFVDIHYFTKLFKKHFGVNPREYRASKKAGEHEKCENRY